MGPTGPRWAQCWPHELCYLGKAKRKPPCIGGMELVSLSCNRVFISSVRRGWCKIAIATKWYHFHTTDKCGFLCMPWIINQYTFVRYTNHVNRTGTAVAKVITFSIMSTIMQHTLSTTCHPTPPRIKIARDISRAELEWLPCDQHAPQCAE